MRLLLVLFIIAICQCVTEGSKGMDINDIHEQIIAPAVPGNQRNTESAIIKLKSGYLLLGWTEFYGESTADQAPARIVGRISKDGGRTWGAKYTLVENDGKCNVMEVNFIRLKNGRIALLHCQKNTPTSDCRVIMRTSADEGKTWSAGKELTPPAHYIALTNGRCIRLRTGRILLETWEAVRWEKPAQLESFCLITDDEGKTWREGKRVIVPGKVLDEPVCVELKDGRVLMIIRTNMGAQYQSISSDGAETWSIPEPSGLVGPEAPAFVTRIPSTKDLLAIWNHNPSGAKRNPLTSAISRDEGKTWDHFRNIEDAADDAFAYPAITWDGGHALLTYFNYKGGLSLKLKSIPEGWFYK